MKVGFISYSELLLHPSWLLIPFISLIYISGRMFAFAAEDELDDDLVDVDAEDSSVGK
jgi:hypothetical protein